MVNQRALNTYNMLDFEGSFDELSSLIMKLQKIRTSTGLVVSDDIILDAAIRLYITSQINKQKPRKDGIMKSEALATEKQLKYLRGLGATIPERLSKERASEIIEKMKEKERG